MVDVPRFTFFMNYVLEALRELGGSGTIEEINAKVARLANLTDEQLEVLHNPERSSQTKFEYRNAWTRTYLKKCGLIDNSERGVWALTAEGMQTSRVDPREIVRKVRNDMQAAQDDTEDDSLEDEALDPVDAWREELMSCLLRMAPDAFERLTQRLLRESGFIQVEVTGRSGDGGIDGKGIMQVGGLMSFHVIFQCKRYKGSVPSREIRDFRGAMVGRADKALFITTGNFTKDAVQEATRDGAPAIDLIDGDRLMDKLKELRLGVETELIEKVTVKESWFSGI